MWARVALAIRCAKRVYPLLRDNWYYVPSEFITSLEKAIQIGEQAARFIDASACDAYRQLASSVYEEMLTHYKNDDCNMRVVVAIKYAICAESWVPDTTASIGNAHIAASHICNTRNVIRRDYKWMLDQSQRDQWTDDTGVSCDFLGDLWPEGKPAGWPKDLVTVYCERPKSAVQVALPHLKHHELVSQLHTEICDSYSVSDLAIDLRLYMDVVLDRITASGSLRDHVFQLIRWAEQHNRLVELIRTLQRQRPLRPRFAVLLTILELANPEESRR
jgi:hypothetical protein